MRHRVHARLRRLTAAALAALVGAAPAFAGISVSRAGGVTAVSVDGVFYEDASGVTLSAADGLLSFGVNGIVAPPAGSRSGGRPDGILISGADGVTQANPTGILISGADGIGIGQADGILISGADGILISGADGVTRQADSVFAKNPAGILISGANNAEVVNAEGLRRDADGALTALGVDAVKVSTDAGGVEITRAGTVTAYGPGGEPLAVPQTDLQIIGAEYALVTRAVDLAISGADQITSPPASVFGITGLSGVQASPGAPPSGLQGVDPELALGLAAAPGDEWVNVVVVYHRPPAESDLDDLRRIGVAGGTRYEALPMLAVTATPEQLMSISRLPAVRWLQSNSTLAQLADPNLALTVTERLRRDPDVMRRNLGVPASGRGVTVAVLDTGVDATHADIAGRVVQNVEVADTQSLSAGFTNPVFLEGLPNTDQVYGHGTVVAGLVAGNGLRSGARYAGVAPGARLLGLSAGDLTLSHVLSGFDYVLTRGRAHGVRVINCSFSGSSLYSEHDPVNVATRMLGESGVSVVFSAGNTGPGLHTLNPYAAAPWVVSVGATDARGRVAEFSSRGEFGSPVFRPTLVAPGVDVVGLRSSASAVTGTRGLGGADTRRLSPAELPFYTTASGTSFSAPQVAGVIALMLEVNPQLTPAQVKDILQRSATPLASHYAHEAGAGMLNAHAAVLEAAFPQRRMGTFRASLDRGQVRFVSEAPQEFGGEAGQGSAYRRQVNVPADALLASVQIGWPSLSTNGMRLTLHDPQGRAYEGEADGGVAGLRHTRERAAVHLPVAGTWSVTVTGSGGPAVSPQKFAGVFEVTRAEYAPLADLGGAPPETRGAILRAVRTFVMLPQGSYFRPADGVTRSELAATLVVSGFVPQYLPAKPSYTDVADLSTMIYVESARAAPAGSIFHATPDGSAFRPEDCVDRLTAAVALVRALGLRAEAEARAGVLPPVTDAAAVPPALRGYVAVALERDLVRATDGQFRPAVALSRAELARALAVISE